MRAALVLGLGASGEGAARLLRAEGCRVIAVDEQDNRSLQERAQALRAEGIEVRLGCRELPEDAAALCVVSPGIPACSPWLETMRQRRVPVVPELELGWSRHRGRTLAVTGTNGKSTMVKWLAESLAAAGYRVQPAGNFGPAVTAVVRDHPALDWLVLEVSSFQLESVREFRADAGLLLNLLPNHLDRHGTFAAYEAAKSRLFAKTRATDVGVAPDAQAPRLKELSGGSCAWVTFGTSRTATYVYDQGRIRHEGRVVADLAQTYFHNPVLGLNAAGGIAALHALGIDLRAAEQAARAFAPLPHRMEPVGERRGVRFINDSKATTLTALAAGLAMCGGPVRLIAGGLLKEHDLTGIREALRRSLSGLYLIGKAAPAMAEAWSDLAPCRDCGTLEQAVRAAWNDARSGEVILLSPACASFDQFANFGERGDRFRNLVKELTGE